MFDRATVLILLLLGCLFLSPAPLSPCSSAQQDDPKPASDPTTVKFELLRSLHIAVPVKINGAGPFRMIFDLGSPVNLVSGKAAADAGLITKEQAKRAAFMGMRGERKAKKLQVGDQSVEEVPVMVMDHPTLKAAAPFLGPIDGIVGYPFYARHRFTIDYPASTITFTPSDYKPQDVMQQMMGRMFASRSQKKVLAAAGLWGMAVEKPADDESSGVVISHVWPGSAADAAGLKPGDRLLTLDGRWTDSAADALQAASFVKPGEAARVVLRRGEESVQIEARPRFGI